MQKRRNNLPMIAFAASLLVHATLLVALPMAIAAATPRNRLDDRDASRQIPLMVLPVGIALGIETPTPETSTWVGFEEPEIQRAEKAEVEQAAFVIEPTAGSRATTAMAPQTPSAAPRPAPQSPSDPQPAPIPTELAQVPDQVDARQFNPPPSSTEVLVGEISLGDDSQPNLDPTMPAPNPAQAEAVAGAIEAVKELWRNMRKAIEQRSNESKKPFDAEPLAPGSAEVEAPAVPPSQPGPQPQPSPAGPQAPAEVGSIADKQSSPTSLIDIPQDQWQLGKPLARQGLTLKPRRPEFTLLTLLTAAPGNPHVVITFGRDGVPVTASLLRSSGDKRVDDAIVASLYRWRAEGKELEMLEPGKSLEVRMRIVLNRRSSQ